MKIDLELVKRSLYQNEIEEKQSFKIIEDLVFASKETETEKEPTAKKQFVIVCSDPYNQLAKLPDFTGWIMQIDESENPTNALNKIRSCVCDFNLTPKGRKMPLRTFAEAFEFLPSKIAKENKVSIKTKTPVLIVKAGRLVALEEI